MRRKVGKVAMRDYFWARLCPRRRHEGLDAHDVHNAGEIVSQYVQRHLSGNPGQRLHQEVRGSHPDLNRAEGMLDRLPSLAHLLRMLIEPALNDFKNVLMLPSADPPLLAGGAAFSGVGPIRFPRWCSGRRAALPLDKCKRPPQPRSGSPACQSVRPPLSSRSSAWAA